jgi:Tfp pilus assembly protein PilN
MKLTLNLLSEERKKEIKNKKKLLSVTDQGLLFLLPVICLILVLLLIDFNLKINSQSQDNALKMEQNQENYKKLKGYEDNFSNVNLETSIILNIQKDHLYWSKVFGNLSAAVPDNVYITQIANQDYQISLAGKAKTRDDFLNFQNNLENSSCFSDVNAPLSDLVSKQDVDFQIDFNVKTDCLKSSD